MKPLLPQVSTPPLSPVDQRRVKPVRFCDGCSQPVFV